MNTGSKGYGVLNYSSRAFSGNRECVTESESLQRGPKRQMDLENSRRSIILPFYHTRTSPSEMCKPNSENFGTASREKIYSIESLTIMNILLDLYA